MGIILEKMFRNDANNRRSYNYGLVKGGIQVAIFFETWAFMRRPASDGQFLISIVSLYQSFLIMKNAVLNLAAFLLLASAFVACKKEKTFKDELVGHWLSTNVTIDGADASTTYTFDLNLEDSREFSLILTRTVPLTEKFIQLYNGDWVEDHSKQDVTLNYTDGDQKTWDIVAISETSMTAELIENSTRYQVVFERQ